MSTTKLDFEMTPQLQEILEREAGSLIHPSMKSETILDDLLPVYYPEMKLPESNDKKAILAWFGFNERVSEKVLKDYEECLANDPDILYQGGPKSHLSHNFAQIFLRGLGHEWDCDTADDFEGYVNSAYRMGLRPEFALLCGIHPDNKYISEDEKERWYTAKGPVDHVEDLVRTWASMLDFMWVKRAKDRLIKDENKGEAEC